MHLNVPRGVNTPSFLILSLASQDALDTTGTVHSVPRRLTQNLKIVATIVGSLCMDVIVRLAGDSLLVKPRAGQSSLAVTWRDGMLFTKEHR